MRRGRHQSGFTLIEAMVASLVISIGFVGSYTLVGFTQTSTQNALIRQKLQMQANQILDLIEADITNINLYNNMDLKTCVAPPGGTTATYLLRKYEWCQRLAADAHAGQAGDTRSLKVSTLADGSKMVQVLLESNSGAIQIVMKRQYVP